MEGEISDENSATFSSGLLLSLVEGWSFLSGLGLFDVQPSAHVFAFVVGNCLVHVLFVEEFNETHSLGSSSGSVSQEVD